MPTPPADDRASPARSALQRWIRARAVGEQPAESMPPAADLETLGTEVWLVSRAASGACHLARRRRPDLDTVALADAIADASGATTPESAALIEDIVVAFTSSGERGEMDAKRVQRDDPARVQLALVQTILGSVALLVDRDAADPAELVDRCFEWAARPE